MNNVREEGRGFGNGPAELWPVAMVPSGGDSWEPLYTLYFLKQVCIFKCGKKPIVVPLKKMMCGFSNNMDLFVTPKFFMDFTWDFAGIKKLSAFAKKAGDGNTYGTCFVWNKGNHEEQFSPCNDVAVTAVAQFGNFETVDSYQDTRCHSWTIHNIRHNSGCTRTHHSYGAQQNCKNTVRIQYKYSYTTLLSRHCFSTFWPFWHKFVSYLQEWSSSRRIVKITSCRQPSCSRSPKLTSSAFYRMATIR